MRKTMTFMLLASMLIATALAGGAGAKPVTTFEDPSGDITVAGNAVPLEASGFDMTKGTIDKVGKDLVWTVEHSAMPPTGTPGEMFRFLWHVDIAGKQYRWTVKSLDIGKPDVVAQSGTERIGQVYPNGVARFEECYVDTTLPVSLSQCTVLKYYDVTFDPAAGTMTWKHPLTDLKLKKGSKIDPGTGGASANGCQICWVMHYAERSLTSTGANSTTTDVATQTAIYKVP